VHSGSRRWRCWFPCTVQIGDGILSPDRANYILCNGLTFEFDRRLSVLALCGSLLVHQSANTDTTCDSGNAPAPASVIPLSSVEVCSLGEHAGLTRNQMRVPGVQGPY
jgi:hypothetical protein